MGNIIDILRSQLEEREATFMMDQKNEVLILPVCIGTLQMEVNLLGGWGDFGIVTRFPFLVPVKRLRTVAEFCCRLNERETIGHFTVSFRDRTISHNLWFQFEGNDFEPEEYVEVFDWGMEAIHTTVGDSAMFFFQLAYTRNTAAKLFTEYAWQAGSDFRLDCIAPELLDTDSIQFN